MFLRVQSSVWPHVVVNVHYAFGKHSSPVVFENCRHRSRTKTIAELSCTTDYEFEPRHFLRLAKTELHSEPHRRDGRAYRIVHIDTTNTKTIPERKRPKPFIRRYYTCCGTQQRVDEASPCDVHTPEVGFRDNTLITHQGEITSIEMIENL